MSTETLERIVSFEPAFDKRNPDPSKNYGIGAARIRFVLKGSRGAVQFLMSTGWYLPHLFAGLLDGEVKWCREHPDYGPLSLAPKGWDVGYHSPVPQYEGQTCIEEACEYLDGRPCYYDGSALQAEPVIDALLREGDVAVWRELEDRYADLFGTAAADTSASVRG